MISMMKDPCWVRLNPCFYGRYSGSVLDVSNPSDCTVLILVLMEDTLEDEVRFVNEHPDLS